MVNLDNHIQAALPREIGKRLQDAVTRTSLIERTEQAVSGTRVVLIVGPTGTGKSIFAAQLAATWQCPCYFARIGSGDEVIGDDPKTMLVSLGLQLRARYGEEVFGPPQLVVQSTVEARAVQTGGSLTSTEIDSVELSPFQQIVIQAQVSIDDLAGHAFGVRIREVRDVVQHMSVAALAREAIVEPLRRLAETHPQEQVRIVVDALDESDDLARAIPATEELTDNVCWVLTSRNDDVLDRFGGSVAYPSAVRLDLAAPDLAAVGIADGRQYALARLTTPEAAALLETVPTANRPVEEIADDLAHAARGNFQYLYTILEQILADARAGRFETPLILGGDLPPGLDGLYRFFVTQRLYEGISLSDRAVVFAPVLGVLAVAYAPLTASQLAAFAGVDPLLVDQVIGQIWPFLESLSRDGNVAHRVYHRSFAEFLLTQDRTRNPYPLRPAAVYHSMIVDALGQLPSADSDRLDDRYTLLYLPSHLLEAHRVVDLSSLLLGTFALRRSIVVGMDGIRADLRAAARAAAISGRDDLLLLLLQRINQIEQDVQAAWQSGDYIVSLLVDDPVLVRERAVFGGGTLLPWSGLLAVERLLDLGANAEALELVRILVRTPWPGYRPPVHGTMLSEGSNVDFVTPEDAVWCLSRIALVDAQLALDLVRRMFVKEARLPNACTAWREVLRAVLSLADTRGLDGVSPQQYQSLAQVTHAWLQQGGFVLGWAGITRLQFQLLARAASVADALWLLQASFVARKCRLEARDSIQGAEESSGLWAALADILLGLQQIDQSAPDGDAQQDLHVGLSKMQQEITKTLGAVEPPSQGSLFVSGRSTREACLCPIPCWGHALGLGCRGCLDSV